MTTTPGVDMPQQARVAHLLRRVERCFLVVPGDDVLGKVLAEVLSPSRARPGCSASSTRPATSTTRSRPARERSKAPRFELAWLPKAAWSATDFAGTLLEGHVICALVRVARARRVTRRCTAS